MGRIRKGWQGLPWGCPTWPCTCTPAPHPQSPAAPGLCRSWPPGPGTPRQRPPLLTGPCGPGAGERPGERRGQEEPSPDIHTPNHLALASAPTWATVPSGTVASGSGVEAASSSHSGVQMFPGRYWGKGGESIRWVCPKHCASGSPPSSQFPQEALSPCEAAHQLTQTPY